MVGAELLETGIDPKFLSQTDDQVKNFLHVIGGSNIVFLLLFSQMILTPELS